MLPPLDDDMKARGFHRAGLADIFDIVFCQLLHHYAGRMDSVQLPFYSLKRAEEQSQSSLKVHCNKSSGKMNIIHVSHRLWKRVSQSLQTGWNTCVPHSRLTAARAAWIGIA